MTNNKTILQNRIESGGSILLAEISPSFGSNPNDVRAIAKNFSGKVHALGISDNRDGVGMSALAAASLVLADGVEPILHMVTRDRNRIALISDCLGAQALDIRNILCTSGTHQTLGKAKAAKNVFDIDSIQLMNAIGKLGLDASIVGENPIEGIAPFCLGGTASPGAEPIELQMMRLEKKIAAGAQFIITQPVFDVERFDTWWAEVTERGIHERVAIIAGIVTLDSAELVSKLLEKRPDPMIPTSVADRVKAKPDADSQRAAGVEIALETIHHLLNLTGLRGFEIQVDDQNVALEVIEKSTLGID